MEAARFVVSDVVGVLWTRMREVQGAARFVDGAVDQLVRWESRHGWTRRGDGWVGQRETSLAEVLAGLVVAPELWTRVATRYLDAMDRPAEAGRGPRRGSGGRRRRVGDLGEWHAVLTERLTDTDGDLLERLASYAVPT